MLMIFKSIKLNLKGSLSSYSYSSYFGQYVVNESNYSTDASLSYLIPNTEFKMDAQLSGFQIGAKKYGKIKII